MRLAALAALLLSGVSRFAVAGPPPSHPLVALAPPASSTDDARRAVALGPHGEVYAPDGKGAWVRRLPATTADHLSLAGRAGAGAAIVAFGEGVVYRLADNGWSAARLTQKGAAIMSSGPRAVAAVGRQLFALDRNVSGEPAKLALAPTPALAIGAGRSIVIATDRGLYRIAGTTTTRLDRAPRRVTRLVSDVWALVDRGAVDLRTNTTTPWPAGVTVQVAALGPTDSLVAVGSARGGLELLTLRAGKLTRDPIAVTPTGVPVGVALDRAGRAVVAFRDGRLAVRDHAAWATVTVEEQLPAEKPGSPPATTP